jgi:hypothetical protein
MQYPLNANDEIAKFETYEGKKMDDTCRSLIKGVLVPIANKAYNCGKNSKPLNSLNLTAENWKKYFGVAPDPQTANLLNKIMEFESCSYQDGCKAAADVTEVRA